MAPYHEIHQNNVREHMCFKNTVNCLVGYHKYTEESLLACGAQMKAALAEERGLSADELCLYDATGNFSWDFAYLFLKESENIKLERYHHGMDTTQYHPFLGLRQFDWFMIRHEGGAWWLLDGMEQKPVEIPDINHYLCGFFQEGNFLWYCSPLPETSQTE